MCLADFFCSKIRLRGSFIVLSRFLLELFFFFFTAMGNWEVEEDDTLAVQEDDEVGKLNEA